MTKDIDQEWEKINKALKSKDVDLLAECDFKILEFVVLNSKQRLALNDKFDEEKQAIETRMEVAQNHFNLSLIEAREKLLIEILKPAFEQEKQENARLNFKKAKLILAILKRDKQI